MEFLGGNKLLYNITCSCACKKKYIYIYINCLMLSSGDVGLELKAKKENSSS